MGKASPTRNLQLRPHFDFCGDGGGDGDGLGGRERERERGWGWESILQPCPALLPSLEIIVFAYCICLFSILTIYNLHEEITSFISVEVLFLGYACFLEFLTCANLVYSLNVMVLFFFFLIFFSFGTYKLLIHSEF